MMDFPCPPPVDAGLLKKYNFFQLYVPDGGGNFIMKELFGVFDDAVITDKLLHTEVMAQFGGMETLELHKFEKWRTIEKSCWINRFYFLVPLARTAWLQGDRDRAQLVRHIMQNFFRQELPPAGKAALQDHWNRVTRRMQEDYNSRSFEEIVKDETDVEYIWYDMQVGQRLICFLYAAFFIWRLIADEAKPELLAGLKLHARVIADQESFQQPYPDNHQSVRAAALWWALPLLQQDSDYGEIYRRTKELCQWHILHEFLPGGMQYEISPSYHAFVVWHGRDFLNLARQRGETVPPEVTGRFAEAARVLACCGRPDGKSLTVNDSYQYDARPLIESLGAAAAKPDFAVIKPGGLAVGRLGPVYAAMDVSTFIGKFSHYHGGKNSVVLLWQGIPFLEETGCPSYDRPEFPLCKRADYHSSLLVDGAGDSRQFGLYGFDGWAELSCGGVWTEEPDGKSFTAELTSNVPEWAGVVWKRTLLLRADGIRITDTIHSSNQPRRFALLFCLAPEVTAVAAAGGFRLSSRGETGLLTIDRPDAVWSEREICSCHPIQPCRTRQLQAEFTSRTALTCVTELRFASAGGR